MTDTCAYCGLGIVPVPESVTGFRHAYQETDGHDAGPDIDPEYPPTAADLDPAVARLTRERDAAMGALKRIKAMSAVAGTTSVTPPSTTSPARSSRPSRQEQSMTSGEQPVYQYRIWWVDQTDGRPWVEHVSETTALARYETYVGPNKIVDGFIDRIERRQVGPWEKVEQ